jgi:hypothetical protein
MCAEIVDVMGAASFIVWQSETILARDAALIRIAIGA